MTEWQCPNCGGGFPEHDGGKCPWCDQPINGSYEYEPPQAITRVRKPEDSSKGMFGKLLAGGNSD